MLRRYSNEARRLISRLNNMSFYSRRDISRYVFYKVKGQKLKFIFVDSMGVIGFASYSKFNPTTKIKRNIRYLEVVNGQDFLDKDSIEEFYESLEDCSTEVIDEFLFNIDLFKGK